MWSFSLAAIMPEVQDNNKLEKEEEDGVEEEEEEKAPKARGHDSGSADLEKVTDYAEDKEILSTGKDLEDALQVSDLSSRTSFHPCYLISDLPLTGLTNPPSLQAIRAKQAQKTAEKLARERELAKVVIGEEDREVTVMCPQVVISKEDVELIVKEMELPRERAERCLREQGGDVVAALTALVNMPVMV